MGKKKKTKEGKVSFYEFFQRFPDEESAEKYFAEKRWGKDGEGRFCPHCGSTKTVKAKDKMPYRCKDCRKRFSVRTGSILAESKVPLHKWLMAVYLLNTNLKGVSSMKLARDLGVQQRTAWFLAHRIRESMKEDTGLFTNPTEADETYIGGLEKNKHESKRKHDGRGIKGKMAVLGVKERESKKVAVKVAPDTTGKTLSSFIGDHVEAGNTVYTDDHRGYNPIAVEYDHKTVKHSLGEYVDGQIHTNGMESFWSMLKRGYIGTYHRMSEKHLQRYADEFARRHNLRQLDTMDQIDRIIEGMSGKRLKYKDLVDG